MQPCHPYLCSVTELAKGSPLSQSRNPRSDFGSRHEKAGGSRKLKEPVEDDSLFLDSVTGNMTYLFLDDSIENKGGGRVFDKGVCCSCAGAECTDSYSCTSVDGATRFVFC